MHLFPEQFSIHELADRMQRLAFGHRHPLVSGHMQYVFQKGCSNVRCALLSHFLSGQSSSSNSNDMIEQGPKPPVTSAGVRDVDPGVDGVSSLWAMLSSTLTQ
jgi:hypothetical protein